MYYEIYLETNTPENVTVNKFTYNEQDICTET